MVAALGHINEPVHDVRWANIERPSIVPWVRNMVFHNANDGGSHTSHYREFQDGEADQSGSSLCCESVLPIFCDVPVLFSSPKGPEKRQRKS